MIVETHAHGGENREFFFFFSPKNSNLLIGVFYGKISQILYLPHGGLFGQT